MSARGLRFSFKIDTQMRGRYKTNVPNAVFREAFKESGLSAYELARRLGYERNFNQRYIRKDGSVSLYRYRRPDIAPVKRSLGLQSDRSRIATQIHYKTALRLCVALNLDPVDVGL